MQITVGAVEALRTRIELANRERLVLLASVRKHQTIRMISGAIMWVGGAGVIPFLLLGSLVVADAKSARTFLTVLIGSLVLAGLYTSGRWFFKRTSAILEEDQPKLDEAMKSIVALETQLKDLLLRHASAIDAAPLADAQHSPTQAPTTASSAETKTCPMCAEDVKAAAKICRYCRHEF